MRHLGGRRRVGVQGSQLALRTRARPSCIIPSFGERYLSTVLYANLWEEASAQESSRDAFLPTSFALARAARGVLAVHSSHPASKRNRSSETSGARRT